MKKAFFYFAIMIIISSCSGIGDRLDFNEDKLKLDSNTNKITDIINWEGINDSVYTIQFRNFEIINYKVLGKLSNNYLKNPLEKDVFLINDTVFIKRDKNRIEKFTGKIRVVGSYTAPDENLIIREFKNKTIALFSIENGAFEGEQLFLVKHPQWGDIYIKSTIIPVMDMIEGINFYESGDPNDYDFKFYGYIPQLIFGRDKYYKFKNRPYYEFNVDYFWTSGFKFYSLPVYFDYQKYTFGNFPYLNTNRKQLLPKEERQITINHYNGALCFEGEYSNKSLLNGRYFTFNNLETDKLHAKLQKSYGEEIGLEFNFRIDDEIFKQYRKYFGTK